MIKNHLHRYELVFRNGEPYVYNKDKDAYHVLAQCNLGKCEAQSALWADKDYVEQLDKWISEHDAPILMQSYGNKSNPNGVIVAYYGPRIFEKK